MRPIELDWKSSELKLPDAKAFPAFYPPKTLIPGLEEGIRRIGRGAIETALGYGSTFSGDATPTSLMDFIAVVADTREFYYPVSLGRDVNLGTTRHPEFHNWWNQRKVNFYSGNMEVGGVRRGIKLGVIGHDEFLKHARGSMPEAMKSGEGKGYLYLAGRLQKAALVPVFSNANEAKQAEIDTSINQARIDGLWLALGLVPDRFTFNELANQYVGLSYLADRRVEKSDKPKALLYGSYENYKSMLNQILGQFREYGIVTIGVEGMFKKQKSLPEDAVKDWLKKSRAHAFKVNFFQNIWTYGPAIGILYGLAKARRASGF